MPTIQRIEKKTKKAPPKNSDMRELRKKAYQNPQWRKLRDVYIKEHPLCEMCLKEGKVTPAEDIHHKISPFKGGAVNQSLLLDYNNLQSLCKVHHQLVHNSKQEKSPEQIIADLDALLNNTNQDDNL